MEDIYTQAGDVVVVPFEEINAIYYICKGQVFVYEEQDSKKNIFEKW